MGGGVGGGGVGEEVGAVDEASEEAAAVGVVGVDDGGGFGVFEEEAGFGGEVGLHGFVVVEVVLGEVGEDGEGETAGADAGLVDGVAGDFDDGGAAAGGNHLSEGGLEGVGVGGGAVGGGVVAGPLFADGGEEAGVEAGLGEHVAQEPSGGGFAVGAGDAAEEEFLGGVAEVLGAGLGKGGARVVHADVAPFARAHDGGGAAGAGLGDVTRAIVVRAGDGDKKGAGDDPARIANDIGEAAHFFLMRNWRCWRR